MNRLLLIAVFVVTWKTYVAKPDRGQRVFSKEILSCYLSTDEFKKEFKSMLEVDAFVHALKNKDLGKNWDIKIYRMEEVK